MVSQKINNKIASVLGVQRFGDTCVKITFETGYLTNYIARKRVLRRPKKVLSLPELADAKAVDLIK